MQNTGILKELADNLNTIRTNAEDISQGYPEGSSQRTTAHIIMLTIDRYRKSVAIGMIKTTGEDYVRWVVSSVQALGTVYEMLLSDPEPSTRKRLLRGYKRLDGYTNDPEFEYFRNHVEPKILQETKE